MANTESSNERVPSTPPGDQDGERTAPPTLGGSRLSGAEPLSVFPPNLSSEREMPSEPWVFAGWGHAEVITDISEEASHAPPRPQHKIGQWRATAICGNDITSSVLYVAAICTLYAGIYAPIALFAVGMVLYLFRKIYAEVGSALPLNGGAYNVLLNTTSKYKASLAACLTLLSYIATAVISSTEALHYLHSVWPHVPVLAGTVALLGLFALLNILGIQESSSVALVIFVLHIATLFGIVGSCALLVSSDTSLVFQNLAAPRTQGLSHALFFGFAAGFLGVSGFESSANFIEEQKPGVFPKTLRNMWIAVLFFNVIISMLAFGVLRLDQFSSHEETLLSEMGGRAAGPWFRTWIGIDAFLVLSGAVLTSYVGVTGLVRRMAYDRCLPQFLLYENRPFGTPHWITISFFVLCCSILGITQGKVGTLAGVYTISFLGVMALFAIGNRLLAVKRRRLPREVRASWGGVALALMAVVAGLIGNVLKSAEESFLFLIYFGATVLAVTIMFGRLQILRAWLYVGRAVHEKVSAFNDAVARWTLGKMEVINSQGVVFFTRGDSPANLRRAVEYVLDNEQTKNLKVVHVYQQKDGVPYKLAEQLKTLDELFPEIRIDFIAVEGRFGPKLVERLSERLGVPRNYMFIGCPGDRFPHNLADLGGVRLIV